MTLRTVSLDVLEIEEEIAAIAEAVESAGLNGSFPRLFVELAGIDTRGKIADRSEGTILVALGDDKLFDQSLAHGFNAGQAETDFPLRADNTEVAVRFVNIRAEDRDAHALALGDFDGEAIGRAHIGGHKSSHEGVGVMSFQVGCPVSNEAITRGVRFVETVVREVEQLTPKLFGNFFGRATDFNRAFNKLWFYLVHEVDFFLTDSLAERIGLATGKTAPFTRNLHELLLVNHNTVSIFQGVFEAGMEVSDRLLAVFTTNEAVDELHWARAVEGHHSDNVLEAVRLEVL